MVTRKRVRGSLRSTTTRRTSDSVRKPLTRRWIRSSSASSSSLTSGSGVQSLNSTIGFMGSDDFQWDLPCGWRERAIEFGQVLGGEVHVECPAVFLHVSDTACFRDDDDVRMTQYPRERNLRRRRLATQRNTAEHVALQQTPLLNGGVRHHRDTA